MLQDAQCQDADLVEAVQDTGDQQDMSILNGADVDEDQVGALADRGRGRVRHAARRRRIKLEQHLLLQCFLEVKLAFIEGLIHLHTKGH